MSLWLYNDLKGGFYLYEGHGPLGDPLGTHDSFVAADKAARRHAQPEYERVKAEMKGLRRAFAR